MASHLTAVRPPRPRKVHLFALSLGLVAALAAAASLTRAGPPAHSTPAATTTGVSVDSQHGYISIDAPDPTAPLHVVGPSFNVDIQRGDDDASQFVSPGFGSVMQDKGAKINLGLVDSNGQSGYYTSLAPRTVVSRTGQVYLLGQGGLGGPQNEKLQVKLYLTGSATGNLHYWVAEITNTDAVDEHLTADLIQADTNFTNGRYANVGADGGDMFELDKTNGYLRITDSGIGNMFLGMKPINSPISHFQVTSEWQDDAGYIRDNKQLPDSVAQSSAGHGNYIFLEHGDTAADQHLTTITPGATATFAWATAYATSAPELSALMNRSDAEFASDMAAASQLAGARTMSVITPDPNLGFLLDIMLHSEASQSKHAQVLGYQVPPAGAASFFTPFARDGYYAALGNGQADNATATRDDFLLFKSVANADGSQQHEAGYYVNGSGLYFTAGNNGTPGDQDLYEILKGYEYFVRTRDRAFLAANIGFLNQVADYVAGYYEAHPTSSGLYAANGSGTYPDGFGNLTGGNPVVDPVMNSLLAYTFRRLAELEGEAGQANKAEGYTAIAAQVEARLPSLYSDETRWLAFNQTPDGSYTYTNQAITKIDALIFDAMPDPSIRQAMLERLLEPDWWDAEHAAFNEVPTTDSLYDPSSYWYGNGWNLTDYKAFSALFRYGDEDQARTAWSRLQAHTQRVLTRNYGQPGEHWTDNGLFAYSLSAVEMVTRGLFGLDAHSSYLSIQPNTWKLGQSFTWRLQNYRAGGASYNVSVSGTGRRQTTYVDGRIQPGNKILYDGRDHSITIRFS
jgi:hypothetical protein